ncbi:MAG: hypothetical protein ACC657_17965 [Thiohalomonadales bacterium]
MSQTLIDRTIDFYDFCHAHNQAWKEVIVRIYMDEKTDKWKCEAKYKYE